MIASKSLFLVLILIAASVLNSLIFTYNINGVWTDPNTNVTQKYYCDLNGELFVFPLSMNNGVKDDEGMKINNMIINNFENGEKTKLGNVTIYFRGKCPSLKQKITKIFIDFIYFVLTKAASVSSDFIDVFPPPSEIKTVKDGILCEMKYSLKHGSWLFDKRIEDCTVETWGAYIIKERIINYQGAYEECIKNEPLHLFLANWGISNIIFTHCRPYMSDPLKPQVIGKLIYTSIEGPGDWSRAELVTEWKIYTVDIEGIPTNLKRLYSDKEIEDGIIYRRIYYDTLNTTRALVRK